MEAMIYPLQAGDGRASKPPVGRGLRRRREPEGRAGLLHGLRRHVQAGALAHPAAVVRQPVRLPKMCEGACSPTSSRSTRASTSSWERSTDERRQSSATARRTAPRRRTPYAPVFAGRGPGTSWTQLFAATRPSRPACCRRSGWCRRSAAGSREQAIGEVAEVLELTPAYVKGVVTFYTMYHTHPVGRHFIQVCTTSPCNICGAEDVVKALLQAHRLRRARRHQPGRPVHRDRSRVPRRLRLRDADHDQRRFIETVTPEKVPGHPRRGTRNGLSRIPAIPKETVVLSQVLRRRRGAHARRLGQARRLRGAARRRWA